MSWLRDLGLGVRFAVGGGREGWTRTALTAVGVGLGVALLLVASSVPHLLDQRSLRDQAREEASASRDADIPESDSTVLRIDAATEYRGLTVEGFLMRAEGSHPVVPPGVTDFPGPGEMAASPALAKLLESPGGALLKERLPYEITTTIADAGLRSPGELYFYAGSDSLTPATGGHRLAGYGGGPSGAPLSPSWSSSSS